MIKTKAALVIGLNYDTKAKLKGMSKLEAAIDCAEDVAAWLEPEFDVRLITDAKKEVTVQRIKDALKEFQGGPGEKTFLKYKMLLIYFAGHGVEQNFADYWVLNHASYDAEEAINLKQACDRASRSGFPVVVMISDACRQDDNLPRALRELNGSHLFFNQDPDEERDTKVDQMRAARVGKAAWEQKEDGKRGFSIFSRALMKATTEPDENNVTIIEEFGQQVRCVTNLTLMETLQSEVNEVLRSLKKTKKQKIFISASSGRKAYIRALPDILEEAAPADPAPDLEEAMEESAAPDDGFWEDAGDEAAAAPAAPSPDFELEPDFALEPMAPSDTVEITDPPPVTDLSGIGPKIANYLAQVGVYTLGDLASIGTEALVSLGELDPRSATMARKEKWQYRAREIMERAGLRLPVSQIAATSLNLDQSEDLPESAGLQAFDVQQELSTFVPDVDRTSFESECGILWSGARAKDATVLPLGTASVEILDEYYNGIGNTVRLWDVEGTASCLVEFEDGRSTIVPVIRGFISYGTLDSVGIQSFGMFPIGAPLGDVAAGRLHDPELSELVSLRGLLTMAMRERRAGAMSQDGMNTLQDRIAAFWHLDPTLAILAAALLMEAGQGRSIPERLADAPHASELFDIALLSSGDHKMRFPETSRTPCPALSANWNYVGSRDAALPKSIEPMRHHLLGSLWTCFDRVPKLKANDIFPIGSGS